MPFVLPDPEGLAPEVYPLAWLVGTWRGEGVVDYPGIDESTFTQEIVIASDGGPYLSYTSTIRLVTAPADTGALVDEPPAPVWQTEAGYWRVPPERPTDWGLTEDQHPVELLVADPSGHVAVYIGAVGKGRIDLVSDAIVRTASGADVSAGKRLYGLVNGELMWAHDIAAFGHPMQSYASGRLARAEALTDDEA
ncbi:FABP family protein [Cellulomonas sp. ICMP 17802]|uniref:FABP family protein n=1 Tax=Cellulomonas sp. ICMP 17802 TaxID=3239199 RepID=UPI00351BA7EC